MKKILFIFLFFFYSNLSLAAESIVLVDIDLVLNKSNYGKTIIEKLKKKIQKIF